MKDNAYFFAFIIVFLAGLSWSFGAVVVRHMENANFYVFQYLFYRGISIAIILITYLIIREGFSFYKNFLKIGFSGVLGGIFSNSIYWFYLFHYYYISSSNSFYVSSYAFYCCNFWILVFK